MPNTHSTLTSLFDDIADAIRAKGATGDIVADNFPTAINAIPLPESATLKAYKGFSLGKGAAGSDYVDFTPNLNAKYYFIVAIVTPASTTGTSVPMGSGFLLLKKINAISNDVSGHITSISHVTTDSGQGTYNTQVTVNVGAYNLVRTCSIIVYEIQ